MSECADALSYLLDNTYIRFGSKLYIQFVGIPMGTHCGSIVADLFVFCLEGDLMTSLFNNNQADVIEALNSRYIDDLFIIDDPYFEGMVNQIYPPQLQFNKYNAPDTESPFWININPFLTASFHPKCMTITILT